MLYIFWVNHVFGIYSTLLVLFIIRCYQSLAQHFFFSCKITFFLQFILPSWQHERIIASVFRVINATKCRFSTGIHFPSFFFLNYSVLFFFRDFFTSIVSIEAWGNSTLRYNSQTNSVKYWNILYLMLKLHVCVVQIQKVSEPLSWAAFQEKYSTLKFLYFM